MLGGIIYKIGLYTIKNTTKEFLKDNYYINKHLNKLKYYRPGNINVLGLVETGATIILFLV